MFVKELGNTAGVPSVYTSPVCVLGNGKYKNQERCGNDRFDLANSAKATWLSIKRSRCYPLEKEGALRQERRQYYLEFDIRESCTSSLTGNVSRHHLAIRVFMNTDLAPESL